MCEWPSRCGSLLTQRRCRPPFGFRLDLSRLARRSVVAEIPRPSCSRLAPRLYLQTASKARSHHLAARITATEPSPIFDLDFAEKTPLSALGRPDVDCRRSSPPGQARHLHHPAMASSEPADASLVAGLANRRRFGSAMSPDCPRTPSSTRQMADFANSGPPAFTAPTPLCAP